MAPQSSCGGREDQTLATASAAASPRPTALSPPAPVMETTTTTMTTVADLTDVLLHAILVRLTPADLLRAALACHRWRRAATRALPRAPPLLGYFFHPRNPARPPPMPASDKAHHPAVFLPLDSASPFLSLDLTPGAASSLSIQDVHRGLVLLLPDSRPKSLLPRVLAVDPASRRRVLLPPPPRDALPDPVDRWRRDRCVLGVAVLSRAHPTDLTFDAVCFTVDGDLPRAWVASVRRGSCTWRALPRAEGVTVDFDPWWFEARCVHAAGNIYWHICNSSRVLQLDPRTLEFSFVPVPAALGDGFNKYRVGETPEDGRLCVAAIVEEESLQIWVRGGDARWSDRGWMLEREIRMTKVLDTVPGLPKDSNMRTLCTWLTDMDYARTGKVFITTWGYGRYSFHLDTGKLERLVMKDGKEHGDPIYAYTLAWPPEFLATPTN